MQGHWGGSHRVGGYHEGPAQAGVPLPFGPLPTGLHFL